MIINHRQDPSQVWPSPTALSFASFVFGITANLLLPIVYLASFLGRPYFGAFVFSLVVPALAITVIFGIAFTIKHASDPGSRRLAIATIILGISGWIIFGVLLFFSALGAFGASSIPTLWVILGLIIVAVLYAIIILVVVGYLLLRPRLTFSQPLIIKGFLITVLIFAALVSLRGAEYYYFSNKGYTSEIKPRGPYEPFSMTIHKEISQEEAREQISACNVVSYFETESSSVVMTLKNSESVRVYSSYEDAIDAVSREIEQSRGRCGEVEQATPFYPVSQEEIDADLVTIKGELYLRNIPHQEGIRRLFTVIATPSGDYYVYQGETKIKRLGLDNGTLIEVRGRVSEDKLEVFQDGRLDEITIKSLDVIDFKVFE